jgi:hypothetical protein
MSISKVGDISQLYADAKTYSAQDAAVSGSRDTTPADAVIFKKTYVSESTNGDIKLNLSEMAGSISKANAAMNTIGGILAKMKGQLEEVVKNYPPFPPGSSDRERMLKSFAGLRKEIDRLTIPPDDEGAAYIMADQKKIPGAGDQQVTTDGTGQKLTVRSQPVHTGPDGLDIPELPVTATNEEIEKTIEKVNVAENMLQSKKSALSEKLTINGA